MFNNLQRGVGVLVIARAGNMFLVSAWFLTRARTSVGPVCVCLTHTEPPPVCSHCFGSVQATHFPDLRCRCRPKTELEKLGSGETSSPAA